MSEPEPKEEPTPSHRWFSKQRILWHFGRYRGDSPKQPPYNRILVGREKERANLIRQLLNLPKRSSFLVTGSRGSGKTRFVDHCLSTYEENLLARYMRTDAGRTYFWDKISLFILLILLSMIPAPVAGNMFSHQPVRSFSIFVISSTLGGTGFHSLHLRP